MKYFFILGNNPTLSVAEISAVFDLKKSNNFKGEIFNKDVFILETRKKVDCRGIIKKMGGVIKIGKVIDEVDSREELPIKIMSLLNDQNQSKIKFGISFYGKERLIIKKLAMQIKKDLKEEGLNGKWISAKFSNNPLSSVAVEGNNLLKKKGVEVVLINYPLTSSYPRRGNKYKDKILIGKTLAVQPFKELSYRDYNRPARDDRSGMIPPKLAQIMLNLAVPVETHCNASLQNNKKVIYDPFCGSGTILSEAILMGYKTIIGSDVSSKAIKDTQENINWTVERYKLGKINANIFQYDSQKISEYLKKPIIDVIVTEPYLGPQRGRIAVNRVRKRLERLYSNSLQEFRRILKPKGQIVMIWPVFRINKKSFEINPKIDGYEIVNPLPEKLIKDKNIKLTNRNTIIYGRSGQRVWREVVVLGLEK